MHETDFLPQLALKHRQNKSQRQRIIVFTCSPLSDDTESQTSLVKLAKRMKKNNVSIDIIALGELGDETTSKLQAFNEAVKGGDGSHLEVVHPGPNLLSDIVVASPILGNEGGGASAGATNGEGAEGGQSGGGSYEFGVDPTMDPELALALRMSMEEENARQERERKATEAQEGKTTLESVPEAKEGESQPLLDQSGEPSGSGTSEDKGEKKDGDGDDKMDTA